jgi:hypothetical protein
MFSPRPFFSEAQGLLPGVRIFRVRRIGAVGTASKINNLLQIWRKAIFQEKCIWKIIGRKQKTA